MLIKLLTKVFGSRNDRTLRRMRKVVNMINAMEPEMEKLSDEELKGKTRFRKRAGKTVDAPFENPESAGKGSFALRKQSQTRHASVRALQIPHDKLRIGSEIKAGKKGPVEQRIGNPEFHSAGNAFRNLPHNPDAREKEESGGQVEEQDPGQHEK